MIERDVERYFCRRVREAGGLAWKFSSPGCSGVPDRLVLFPDVKKQKGQGRIFFVELKRPNAKVRPLQKKVHERLREMGFAVYVIHDKAETEAFLREMGRIE